MELSVGAFCASFRSRRGLGLGLAERRPKEANTKRGRTYWMILDFSFGGRKQKSHGMVLELVPGADYTCVLHHFSSLALLMGSWGQVWPESGQKPKLKFRV